MTLNSCLNCTDIQRMSNRMVRERQRWKVEHVVTCLTSLWKYWMYSMHSLVAIQNWFRHENTKHKTHISKYQFIIWQTQFSTSLHSKQVYRQISMLYFSLATQKYKPLGLRETAKLFLTACWSKSVSEIATRSNKVGGISFQCSS